MANQPAHRPVKYQPYVAQKDDGPFSAEDVNRLLMEAEKEFETYIRALEAENAPNKALVATQITELQTLTELMFQKQADIEELQETIKDQTRQIEQLNAECASAHKSLETLRNSTSWRLTKPLRHLTAMFRAK